MCQDKNEKYLDEAITEIRKRILSDHYVFASVNERMLSAKGNTYGFDHDCFLYGLDDESGVYKSFNAQYLPYDILYAEYRDAPLSLQKGVVEFQFLRE